MDKLAQATLESGEKIPYIIKDNPPRGGMKYTYFAPDRSYVVQFFNDVEAGNDPNLRARLEAIINRYNPTVSEEKGGARGNSQQMADYFSKRFCWPLKIVKQPEFGIVCPAYPSNYFFEGKSSTMIDLNGKDKKSNWFTSRSRQYLDKSELGDFRSMLQMSIMLARSVRRMHQAGLAHSDLSNNNVLIDPKSGSCVVIDIDSLVVPGIFPPEVIGTRGYMAPEILETYSYPYNHPNRKSPSTHTDLHALPVLIYEYLFFRHPLLGPKIYSVDSAEEDDFLALGPKATFIENPHDTTNRPSGLKYTIQSLGPILENLFIRAFVNGLHDPNERPTAMEWERGLVQTWDLLHKCQNPICEHKWFVLYDINKPSCPFCGTRLRNEQLVRLKLKTEMRGRTGHWMDIGEMDVAHNTPLFKWHIFGNIFPDEKADRQMQAYMIQKYGQWYFVNQDIHQLEAPDGGIIPIGHAFLINDGDVFKASRADRGMLIEIAIKTV